MEFKGGHESLLRLSTMIQETEGDNLMVYKGAFDRMPFSMIETYCEGLSEESPVVKKKIRSVFVEMAQNINFYSLEQSGGYGVGYISVNRSKDGYTIISGNTADEHHFNRLNTRIKKMELLNNDTLHGFKQKLMLENFDYSENANIGVVQCAIIANSHYEYEFVKTDDGKYFITLKIEVKTIKKD